MEIFECSQILKLTFISTNIVQIYLASTCSVCLSKILGTMLGMNQKNSTLYKSEKIGSETETRLFIYQSSTKCSLSHAI